MGLTFWVERSDTPPGAQRQGLGTSEGTASPDLAPTCDWDSSIRFGGCATETQCSLCRLGLGEQKSRLLRPVEEDRCGRCSDSCGRCNVCDVT